MSWETVLMVCVLVIVIAGGIVAIKFAFNFKVDLVERRKLKDKKTLMQMRTVCPHTELEKAPNGEYILRSLFVKPPMSFTATCKLCGYSTADLDEPERLLHKWNNDLKGLSKGFEEYCKLSQKYVK